MNNIKRYTEYLFESKQRGRLYHFTNIQNLFKILESNVLKGKSRMFNRTKTFDKKYKKGIGISLTRDKKISAAHVDAECIIVLDGDKISNNYKITPYDDFSDFGGKVDTNKPLNRKEFEERVMGPIKNIRKFIVGIIMLDNVDIHSTSYKTFYVDDEFNYEKSKGKNSDEIIKLASDKIEKLYNINTVIENKKQLVNKINCFECNDRPTKCKVCDGTGLVEDQPCDVCEGTGVISCDECNLTYYE